MAVVLLGACGGHKGTNGSKTPRVTVGADGPLAPGLLTETQVRQVPTLSSATITSLQQTTFFEDPDPRGPCGAQVPSVTLQDAVGIAIKATGLRGGAELVSRMPPGEAKRYLDARMADAHEHCPEYQTTTHQGVTQRVLLVRIVRLHKEFQQALAVVMAIKIGQSVRAATVIEVRRDDVLARTIIFSNRPIANVAVRGLASLMGRDLTVFTG